MHPRSGARHACCLLGLTHPRGIKKPLDILTAGVQTAKLCWSVFICQACVKPRAVSLLSLSLPAIVHAVLKGCLHVPKQHCRKVQQMSPGFYIYLSAPRPLINHSQAASKSSCTVLCQRFACTCKLQTEDLEPQDFAWCEGILCILFSGNRFFFR